MSINRREFWQWEPENIKRCDKSIGKCQAHASDFLVAPRVRQNAFLAAHHASAASEQPKKFHVFHQGHFWKAANVQEGRAPAE